MRRWLAILLLVFLPLQSLWVAAAPYCGHEEGPAAVHIGHHTHEHQQSQADIDPPVALDPHSDCHVCHGAAAAVSAAVSTSSQAAPPARPQVPSRSLPAPPVIPPERPNWARLA
jgi:hypothetical protein